METEKELLKRLGRFELVDPNALSGVDEWVEWLEAVLHGSCYIFFHDGEMILIEGKQLVARLSGLKIEIYPNEHAPPHFHVKAPGVDASFSIEDCRLLRGDVPRSAQDKIRYWHRHAKPMLIEVWNKTRPSACQVGEYRES